jgi:hypothetical protein
VALFSAQELRQSGQTVARSHGYTSDSYVIKSLSKFSVSKSYDIFLSHSFLDASIILGLKKEFEDLDYSVYIDWVEDTKLDRTKVTSNTADVLRQRMQNCECLLFAHSNNSSSSIWMPWELGYFDAFRSAMVAILPIVENPTSSDQYVGQEYLGLYYYITKSKDTENSKETLWVNKDSKTYIDFDNWLQGQEPYTRK